MKLLYKVMTFILSVVLLVATSVSIIYSSKLNQNINTIDNKIQKNKKIPKYHFVIIANDSESSFWEEFKKGALKASGEFNVIYEFQQATGINNNEKSLQYLDIAIASRVDGIVVQAFNRDDYNYYINKAHENKIPVVTIESDAPASERTSFVGSNYFELGSKAANLMVEATNGKANIAVILENSFENEMNISSNLQISGFKDIISKYDQMKIVTVESSSAGLLSAEDITSRIMREHPEVDAILCTSSKDTVSVAQVVIDFNKVNKMKIIGYDVTTDILNYIQKQIIYGSVMRNPDKVGYASIKTLCNIKEGKITSDFIDTGVKTVTIQNIDKYK